MIMNGYLNQIMKKMLTILIKKFNNTKKNKKIFLILMNKILIFNCQNKKKIIKIYKKKIKKSKII